MFYRERRIHNAVGEALSYMRSQEFVPNPDTYTPGPDETRSVADYPDDTLVNVLPLPTEPDTVLLKNPRELAAAIESFGVHLRIAIHDEAIAETVDHEREHAEAFAAVGFRAVRYRLNVFQQAKDRVGYIASASGINPSRPLTKIALAATVAAPAQPSMSDRDHLRHMGYDDLASLGQRIHEYNQLSGASLPLPGTFSGQ